MTGTHDVTHGVPKIVIFPMPDSMGLAYRPVTLVWLKSLGIRGHRFQSGIAVPWGMWCFDVFRPKRFAEKTCPDQTSSAEALNLQPGYLRKELLGLEGDRRDRHLGPEWVMPLLTIRTRYDSWGRSLYL